MKTTGKRFARVSASSLLLLLLLSLTLLLLSACVHSKTKLELAQTYYNLGNAYSELEEWNRAGEAYLRAMEIDPSFRRAGFQMARVYVQGGEFGKAENILEDLYGRDSENQEVEEYLGWIYVQRGKKKEAKEVYENILEKNPADCDVRYNLALIESEEEEWKRSYEVLKECLDYGSGDAEIYRLLGKAKLELGEEGAIGFLEKAYEEKSSLPGLKRDLARAYREEEYYRKAVEMYEKVAEGIDDAQKKGEIYFEMAFIYFTAIEDYERGKEYLDKALESGYRDGEAFEELLDYPRLIDPESIEEVFRKHEVTGFESED